MTKELWKHCQEILSGRYTNADKRKNREFSFSGLVAYGTSYPKMYVDKLDGKILGNFFDSMSAKWRAEQSEILQAIKAAF